MKTFVLTLSMMLVFLLGCFSFCDAVSLKEFYNNYNSVEDNTIPSHVTKQSSNNVLTSDEKKLDEPPCKIFHSQFGCCWDNRTIAKGPDGYGCPACKDEDKFPCKWYEKIQFCSLPLIKSRCPVTCQLPCAQNCRDDDGMEKVCHFFKQLGSCKFMKHVCKKTCGVCYNS